MNAVAQAETAAVARPLHELVPLIKAEIAAGDAAALEHYRRAGEMLLEAKGQVAHGEWGGWIGRNFHLSQETARRYMRLAEIPTVVGFSSMREALGRTEPEKRQAEIEQERVRAEERIRAHYREQEELRRERLRTPLPPLMHDFQAKVRERELQRQLASQMIDAGYKVLAAKLHPDKGGSDEAMARLNSVRKALKQKAAA